MTFRPTGLLVATSDPDGAKVWVDGKLKGATNSNFSLTPKEYRVEIKKDGYTTWNKTANIEKEMVVKTDAILFPLVPDLKALTFTGAENPIISPDGSKVVYITNSGLWILDLNDFPFGMFREPRQILQSSVKGHNLTQASFHWSPDSKQILLTFTVKKTEENFLIDSNNLILESDLKDISQTLYSLNLQWLSEQQIREDQKTKKLPPVLVKLLHNNADSIVFSPDETKILYTATGSAQIPENLIPVISAASTQKQERTIKPDQTYVYDIKEDRNYFILGREGEKVKEQEGFKLNWFPTSRHLILVEKNKVTIMESDGTNRIEVYTTPFSGLSAFPMPSGTRLLVLTSLSSNPKTPANLYAVNLK